MRPSDPPAASLALVAGVALHEAASLHVPELSLKWPNDLLADGAKLAGVLLEREADAIVAGFGVNLAYHPHFVERPATSIAALAGAAPDPDAFLADLATALEKWLACWRADGIAPVRQRWLEIAHPLGTPLVSSDGAGRFDGLDAEGALRLRLDDGSVRIIRAGDVFLI